jgi:hypothetical protein
VAFCGRRMGCFPRKIRAAWKDWLSEVSGIKDVFVGLCPLSFVCWLGGGGGGGIEARWLCRVWLVYAVVGFGMDRKFLNGKSYTFDTLLLLSRVSYLLLLQMVRCLVVC